MRTKFAVIASLLTTATCVSPAFSTGSTDPSVVGDGLQEIIVTATKRDERIQDVPMSVSAITGADLAQVQALDLQDIATRVPGLNLQQGATNGFGAFGTRLILRGENAGGGGAVVATAVDDIPFSFSGANSSGAYFATDLEPYDMSRIEVLRGPQGTLYGATAEGGLVKYVTNAPDPTAYHAGVEGGALGIAHGGVGESGKGYVNLPLINDVLALRATGYYESIPGWIRDDLNHTTKINDDKRYGGRLSLLWQPSADFSIRGTVFIQDLEVNGNDQVEVNGGTSTNPFGLINGYNFNVFLPNEGSDRAIISSLRVDWNLHWARLESISSYGKLNVNFGDDVPFYENLFGAGTTLTGYGSYDLKKYSQELRLVSEPGNELFNHQFDWQLGLFYTREITPTQLNYVTRGYPSGNPIDTAFSPTSPLLGFDEVDTTYREVAGYFDGTYHFTSRFDLDAGARVFHNAQGANTTQGGILISGSPDLTTLPSLESSESKATYSVAGRWHFTPDTMSYVRVASGYRPGGPEVPIVGAPAGVPTYFGSDRTTNYEVGFKGLFLDKTLNIDVDAFYIDWKNIQVPFTIVLTNVAYNPIENAASAVSKGLEWTLDWQVFRGFTVGTLGAYTDAHLTADAPGIGAKDGDRLAYVPKVSGNVHALYTHPITADISGFVGTLWSYTGSRFNDFATYMADINSHQKIPAYTTLEAQAGIRKDKFLIEFYGKNLTDQRGITSYSGFGADVSLTPGYAGLIRPRTIGVRVGVDF